MFFSLGMLIVIGCVFGGYAAMGANLMVLWQPLEFVIIIGAAIGSFIIGNPKSVLSKVGSGFGYIVSGPKKSKADYVDLLACLYALFKLAKRKGLLAIESHIEHPEESELFNQFPNFLKNHHAVNFLCDYMRLMTMGSEDPHQMEDLMNEELETHHHEYDAVSGAITTMGDGLPALGIVAAVLGVIKTMGAITQPPEILGHHIGGALVGTFLGVLLAYGFVGPMGSILKAAYGYETKYFECMKLGILAHMKGHPPAVSIEFARKVLTTDVRPSFQELEEMMKNVSTQ